MRTVTELAINGRTVRITADAERSLLSVLRDDLEMTGVKYGCGEGQCGACTVLIDGSPARSCTTEVSALAGKQITTIEGLEQNGKLHPVQQSFMEADAMQCGYCTCGMIMSAVGLLRITPNPSRDEIIKFMNGNICRCGTYQRIVMAILRAAAARKGAGQ